MSNYERKMARDKMNEQKKIRKHNRTLRSLGKYPCPFDQQLCGKPYCTNCGKYEAARQRRRPQINPGN